MSLGTLLIIDPQVDFHGGGSLSVPGAEEDSVRIAELIDSLGSEISEIIVTLDTHFPMHIAHSCFWTSGTSGKSPPPFEVITRGKIEDRTWLPVVPSLLEYCKMYTGKLESLGRLKLTIWPEHCIVGTAGHEVVHCISAALQRWCSLKDGRNIIYVTKGMNMLTESYSALKAEVPFDGDRSTDLNEDLLRRLLAATQVIVCGQAMSHCVNYTVRDILENMTDPTKLVILQDGMSPVRSCEDMAEEFIQFVIGKGVRLSTCKELLR